MTLVRRARSYTEAELDGRQRRFSLVVAVFGASCNMLCLILTLYQDDSFSWQDIRHPRDVLIFFLAFTLAPSLVLLAFRYYFGVVLIYASMLFCILISRIEYPHQYYVGQKYDSPGVFLVFFGLISAAVVAVWATIRFVIFMWRVLKSNRAG
jgi:hypothetical protein